MWEALTLERVHATDDAGRIMGRLALGLPIAVPPSTAGDGITDALDAIAEKGLAREPADRFTSALEMADAIEQAVRPATASQVSEWLHGVAGDALEERLARVRSIESSARDEGPSRSSAPGPNPSSEAPTVATFGSAYVKSRKHARARSRLWWGLVLLAGALALGALGQRTRILSWLAAGRVAPVSSATDPPPAAPQGIEPSAPAPSAPALGAPAPSAPALGAPMSKGAQSLPSRPVPARPRNCKPPYTVDEQGIRHMKPECL
jgi:serine/threonine-protein kinase